MTKEMMSVPGEQQENLIPYAVGGQRFGTVENRSGTFAQIASEVLQPLESDLTREEFLELPPNRQAFEKGSHGFWLRTTCLDGIRRNDHVEPGRILTLDLDYLEESFLHFMRMVGLAPLVGVANFWHTSRSHSATCPKVRLAVLLSRDVIAPEYEFVARIFGELIGLEKCDSKGFRPAQMMFKPTTHKGELENFVSEFRDGKPLDVDALINEHPDAIYSDPSTWPRLPNEKPLPNTHGRKAEYPLDKGGLVGAFCRAHPSLSDEIDDGLLTEFYLSSARAQGRVARAQWIGGSGGEGVLVYDDVFLYSHHESDPCGDGRVHNIWDAVRIHRFGELDDQDRQYTNPSSRPSWKAMVEFANNDEATREQLLVELSDAYNLLEVEEDRVPATAEQARSTIIFTVSGQIAQTMTNAIAYLTIINEENNLRLSHNELTGEDEWKGGLEIKDADLALIRVQIEQRGFSKVSDSLTASAVRVVAMRNAFNPVTDYLDGLVWDGVPRLSFWLSTYARVVDSPYARAVGRAWIIQLVARAYIPGCKADHVLTLIGDQGIRKSTLCAVLGGPWYGDGLPSIAGHNGEERAAQWLPGHWVVELSEMAPTRAADIESLKAFLSRGTDKSRHAYARLHERTPRRCAFIATTNNAQFIRDKTGGRRFWPVNCEKVIDIDGLRVARDQLFAEARDAFNANEPWHLSEEIEQLAREAQEEAAELDPWEELLSNHIQQQNEQGKPAEGFSTTGLLGIVGMEPGRWCNKDAARMGQIMKGLGYTKRRRGKDSSRKWWLG
ncbi:hypothetical protein GQ651_09195 [Alphaproteobacteria bacterium GH1-50]|uniref:Virulence-associated protein E-like domain-containing protein n=1 Tax=Kangsaoukella pontilimi TaxID=2691042 RepID=A0A7C9NE92_9RHOB|nr:virulence-associated E family protein [Kangsaoukella pontilimi]MXQ08019.1 hypothetical protein [Kangsaoukella pontilimi]